MKKLMIVTAAMIVAGSAVAAKTPLTGINLRLGVFLPSDSATQEVAGDTWFAAGVDYKIKDMDFGSGSQVRYALGLSVDWAEKSSVRSLPVLLTLTGSQGQGVYWLAGAGVSFNKFGSENETKFAYTVGIGYEFKSGMNPISVEARFQGNARSELNGIGVFAGFRF